MDKTDKSQDNNIATKDKSLQEIIRDRVLQNQNSLLQIVEIYDEYCEYLYSFKHLKSGKIFLSIYKKYLILKEWFDWLKQNKDGKLKQTQNNQHNQQYDKNYNTNFKPYQIQYLYPIENNRPRILHAIQNFITGGSSRLVVDIIEHLGHRFEQRIITNELPSPPSYIGVPISAYPYFVTVERLFSYMQKFKPDIVHVHYWGWGNQSWDWGWRSLLWYHRVFEAANKYGCPIIENVNIPCEPYISDAVKNYVYVSNYLKNKFGLFDNKETIIYPGSNFTHFCRRSDIDIPDDCIGMVYRLDKDKLNESSINVFIEVVKRRKNTKVLIVGGGVYLEDYKNKVRQSGFEKQFTFTGLVSYQCLPKLYEQLSIFVAPVWRESFGQVSPFAMSMKIPVVGYNIGALEEIIGDSDLLAPPGDIDKLADIIISLLDNRARRLDIGLKNCQRAQQLFSVQTMIEKYNILYDSVLSSGTVKH